MSHSDDLPQSFPREITIGENLEFEKDFEDYPADEYTVTYYLRGAGPGLDIAGTADGTTHVFTKLASQTTSLVAGRYDYQAIAVKGPDKFRVDYGTTKVLPSLAAVNVSSGTYDGRSNAKKIIDAIDALMAGKATIDQQEYMIAGAGGQRMLRRIDPVQLIEVRKYYARIVRRENSAGKSTIIFAQFD